MRTEKDVCCRRHCLEALLPIVACRPVGSLRHRRKQVTTVKNDSHTSTRGVAQSSLLRGGRLANRETQQLDYTLSRVPHAHEEERRTANTGRMSNTKLRAGDVVVVRSPAEILGTLDADGRLDGLPFMPEMLEWYGKSFRVSRRVEKTCMEVQPQHYPNRRFASDDVVFLDGPRCDGGAHDGCHRGCRIFWKEAWLRPTNGEDIPTRPSESGLAELRARLQVKVDADRYVCQSTELFRATEEFPGKKKPWMLRIAFREVWNGDVPIGRIVQLFFRSIRFAVPRAFAGHDSLRGTNQRTPSESLDLRPGELVRVKSRARIAETLDVHGRNRGMGICEEMTRLCGREAEVRHRVDRIIEEKTGKMRPMQHSVMLRNLQGDPSACEECLCHAEMGDCPRGELMYWREIWLERAQDQGAKTG